MLMNGQFGKPALLGLVLLLSISAACTIKEERSACPCYLNLNFDSMAKNPDYTQGLITVMNDKVLDQNRVRLEEYVGCGYEVAVPKGSIGACMVTGHEDLWWHSDTLYAATNLQWGPVMLANSISDCNTDEKWVLMDFHKEYCRVNIILVGVTDMENYPFDLRMRANCNGVRMRDRKAVEGLYKAFATPQNTAVSSLLLPRQADNELMLDVFKHKDDRTYAEGDLVTIVNVGKVLSQTGYDWTKSDLDDIYVTLDVVNFSLSVSVAPWENNNYTEII